MKLESLKNVTRKPLAIRMERRVREGLFIISIALALFMLVSFMSYHNSDPGWLSTGTGHKVANACGHVGAFVADIFLSLFGYVAYLFPFLVVMAAWLGVRESRQENPFQFLDFCLKSLGFIAILITSGSIAEIFFPLTTAHLPANSGGIMGDLIGNSLTDAFNVPGGALLLIAGLLCGITLFTGLSWLGVADAVGLFVLRILRQHQSSEAKITKPTKTQPQENNDEDVFILEPKYEPPKRMANFKESVQQRAEKFEKPVAHIVAPTPIMTKSAVNEPQPDLLAGFVGGNIPPLSLLNPPQAPKNTEVSAGTLQEMSDEVEKRLLDFGVVAKVVAVHPGPVITRFELELAPGIKVSKISGLAKDLARSLSAISVRVVEVIPGKSTVGLELPNEHREVVCLREVLESKRYAEAHSPVSLALGKDIAGHPVIVDLAKMPHLLVAGTTGSGKSVGLNAMLLSMLYKSTPEELRLVLIDPKMLELSVYEGIPHLLTPVITDMKEAANALRWCVAEMDRRYRLMSLLGVRNLSGYNQKISEAKTAGQPLLGPPWMAEPGSPPPELTPLPMIVVIADELADMMMVVGKKVEELIARIAQKARAAGIHLLLATQRPSVDVITGLIKANIPTRISFQVSSRIDSRTILDQQGAEQLLGHGDMLYLPPGTGLPVRVHGAYVADEEVHRVVAAWRTYGKPDYLNEILETESESNAGGSLTGDPLEDGEADPLYDQAVRIITEARRASVSLIQRRLKIGFNRAARIMEEMEAAGVVSTMDSNGTREVLANAPPSMEEN